MSGDPDGAAVWIAVSAENLTSDDAVRVLLLLRWWWWLQLC